MRVVVRAFNKDGYYKDIVVMSEQQVHQADSRVDEQCLNSIMTGLIGVSVGFEPAAFPEVAKFNVVIESIE
jgi:hypothetical protein